MDPQSWRARYDCCKRVYVERNHAAKKDENEWVPLERRKKMAVKKLNGASRHSARHTGQIGKIVKHAVGPG
jgi:hypothetical protein